MWAIQISLAEHFQAVLGSVKKSNEYQISKCTRFQGGGVRQMTHINFTNLPAW